MLITDVGEDFNGYDCTEEAGCVVDRESIRTWNMIVVLTPRALRVYPIDGKLPNVSDGEDYCNVGFRNLIQKRAWI